MNLKDYWNNRTEKVLQNRKSSFRAFGHAGQSRLYDYYMHRQQKITLKRVIASRFEKGRGKKVLEIGASMCRWASLFESPEWHYTGVDHSSKMLGNSGPFLRSLGCSAYPSKCVSTGQCLPLRDNRLDLVMSVTVLQHIPWKDKVKTLEEMKRITRSGGFILLLENIELRDHDINRSVEGLHLFPRSKKQWLEMSADLGLRPVVVRGEEDAVPLRIWMFVDDLLFRHVRNFLPARILRIVAERGRNYRHPFK